ncbi:trypsin-like peptidase domain-containing protein [Streptomyces sp. NPDC000410]|uniref:trypsin-like peptidase domain-containing protein n=1 Tax=Streptomyces sp. NPDC000410 TaxID=3154254 RepID=UPI00332683F6
MTANAERGLRPERVAEIIVTLPDGATGRRGSGYLVSSGTVLTAAHVVEGAAGVRVRFEADRPGERTVEAAVRWQHAGIDIAVLALPGHTDPDSAPVRYGRVGEQDAVLRCTALGFPRFKLRTGTDGSRFRDAEHAHATCAVLSNRREGTLDLGVTAPPAQDPDPERDAWEGMSGAAVFTGGRLVGVVTRHHRTDGPGRIAASRVDRWAEALRAPELAELEAALGRGLHPAALPDAVPVAGRDLIQEAHRAQLADIAPEQLEGREAELRELVEFCGGPDPYRWLQGPPWAGKTALAAWFALHPPRGVVPVWFFITARYASQADGEAYTAAVTDQLAAVVGREPTGGSPVARDGERRLLLRQAAERVAGDGGTLLLLVDGLDEDQSLLPGGSGTSIASLLPERLPPNVRVLATSRPGPGLPPDVRGGHPLRHCTVAKLSATAAARHTEYEAKYDLHEALTGDALQRDLVGLLTAARGALTLDDLRELTGEQGFTLDARLGSAFGRILRLRRFHSLYGGDQVPSPVAEARGYLFAHETLLAAAQDAFGPDVAAYQERLHTWAETYARRGWPAQTPPYLLQPYGRLLALLGDVPRAARLATDAGRRDRLREVTGSDAACLAEIAAAHQIVRRATPDDLGALAALAAAGDLVARRNESLHPDIPAAYARLGRTRHAIGLAHSVYDPMDRARALEGVARVLAEAGDRQAVELAQEAVRLAETAVGDEPWTYSDEAAQEVAGTYAAALAATGRETEALRHLGELRPADTRSGVERLVAIAVAFADPARVDELLRRAEESAQEIEYLPDRIHALGAVARARAATDPGHAERLYDSVVALAGRRADSPSPAAAAEVLHRVRPRDTERMVRLAVAHADGILRDPATFTTFDQFEGAVRALAVTGAVDEAQRLMEALRERLASRVPLGWPGTWMWMSIAEGRAGEGRAAEAWAALEAAWADTTYRHEGAFSAAPVVGLLAAAGAADQLESVLLAAADPGRGGAAEALAALAVHFAADDPDRSLRLLRHTETGRHPAGTSVQRDEHLAVLAGALVTVGRPREAERLIGAMGVDEVQRTWAYAVVSVATAARGDSDRALHLAEQAADMTSAISDEFMRSFVSTSVVQALASVGAGERAAEVVQQLTDTQDVDFGPHFRNLARIVVAAGLWPDGPDTASALADVLLPELHDAPLDLAGILAAVASHDTRRIARIEDSLHGAVNVTALPKHQVLLALLTATADPAAARLRLDEVASKSSGPPPFNEANALAALAYAALGDHAAARAAAQRIATEPERAEALAALAGYAACVPGDPMATRLTGLSPAYLPTVRRLAALLHPPRSGPDPARARALLADALTPDGWHHAVPVLASLDPEAVLRVRDVVFAHLGLDIS